MEDKKSFIKKTPVSREEAEEQKNKPVYDEKFNVVFVNGSKFRRAKTILDLIRGEKVPSKNDEIARKDHYTRQLAKNEIDVQSEEALPALYELLGGLIRTKAEQEFADEKAKEMKAKGKRKMIE